mmetsp:Transcript_17780/g.55488  ORF Transcript_17780/g.55488 Transcript_17780/m.55488 type:complete len:422 (+) Transcript_17780:169-1434(+)
MKAKPETLAPRPRRRGGRVALIFLSIADALDAALSPLVRRLARRPDPRPRALGPVGVVGLYLLCLSVAWAAWGWATILRHAVLTLRYESARRYVLWFAIRGVAPVLACAVGAVACRALVGAVAVEWLQDHLGLELAFVGAGWAPDLLGAEWRATDLAAADADRAEVLLLADEAVLTVDAARATDRRIVVRARLALRRATLTSRARVEHARWSGFAIVLRRRRNELERWYEMRLRLCEFGGRARRYVAYDDSSGDSSLRRALRKVRRTAAVKTWRSLPLRVLAALGRLDATIQFDDGATILAARARSHRKPAKLVFEARADGLGPPVVAAPRGLRLLHARLLREVLRRAEALDAGADAVLARRVASNARAELSIVRQDIESRPLPKRPSWDFSDDADDREPASPMPPPRPPPPPPRSRSRTT